MCNVNNGENLEQLLLFDMGSGPETRQPLREALYAVIYYVYAGDVSLPIIAGDSVVNSIVHHFKCVHTDTHITF